MPTSPVTNLIEQIRRAATPEGDGELLGRFVERRDERALATLVDRHGPMVWGVCRRLLSHHDAEDAFQATFIVLVKKAASVRPREMVGNWLFGVARQAALQARSSRRWKEMQVTEMPDVEAPQDRWADVRPILDEELGGLPSHYRVVIVLSDLEGRSRKDVAAHLGCPEGTVASRLVRARAMLAKRLTQRGVALSGVALTLAQSAASTVVPASVVSSTIKAATLSAAGHAAIPVKVAALAEGVLKTMLLSKFKSAVAVVLVLMAAGAGILSCHTAAGQGDEKPAEPATKQVDEKNTKPGNGPAKNEKQKLTADQARKLLPHAAGISNEDFEALLEKSRPETVKSKSLSLVLLTLKPPAGIEKNPDALKEFRILGEDIKVSDVTDAMRISRDKGYASFIQPKYITDCTCISTAGRAEGVVSFKSDRFAGRIPFVAQATRDGWVITEFRLPQYKTKVVLVKGVWVQESLPGTKANKDEKKPAVEKPVEPAVKEAFTAWGKEVGGLQAGLAADTHTVRQGEKLELTVKLRNVGKADIKVASVRLQERPPSVTDVKGGQVSLAMPPSPRNYAAALELVIKPGETISLYKPEVAVQPEDPMRDGEVRVDCPTIFAKPGKYKIAYAGMLTSHPKLATGGVEFEVKPAMSVTAWGKEIGGLQAGLSAERRVYGLGEKVTLVVRVRNVGKEAVRFQYLEEYFIGTPPAVRDGKGKAVPLERRDAGGLVQVPVEANLTPGKEVELSEVEIESRNVRPGQWNLSGTGKYSIQYDIQYQRLVRPDIDVPGKFATGKLEIEVKDRSPEKR